MKMRLANAGIYLHIILVFGHYVHNENNIQQIRIAYNFCV